MKTRTRNGRARRGHTLPELMVSMSLIALLLGGSVSVFLMTLRLSGSVTAASLSSTDASFAVQRITADLHEANSFALLDNPTYDATDKNGNVVITGITISFPISLISAASGDGKIYYTTGANVSRGPLTGADVPYNCASASAATVSFYRANWHQTDGADGSPNPATGKCLWVTGTENGAAVTPGPVITTIAPTVDAVQFVHPMQPGGLIPILSEAQIKIVSGQYDPIHGSASSDSVAGGATALTGDCVYLQNRNLAPPAQGGANGKKFYFGG